MIFLEPSFLALAVAFIAVTAWPMPEAWFRLVLGGFSLAFLALCLGPALPQPRMDPSWPQFAPKIGPKWVQKWIQKWALSGLCLDG